jgi:hypothetical protein
MVCESAITPHLRLLADIFRYQALAPGVMLPFYHVMLLTFLGFPFFKMVKTVIVFLLSYATLSNPLSLKASQAR